MQVLTHEDEQLLYSTLRLSQAALKNTLHGYLKKKYSKVINHERFIIAVGDVPIGIVAHMDTVFSSQPEDIYYDKEKGVLWSPDGLGGDDRAGIFAIIKILQKGIKPTIILTTDEEIGGLGAEAITKEYKLQPPTQLNYIIELDRRGRCDCVFYDCANNDFIRYIEHFGFIENFGSFSDISILCPHWGIAGVNLSVGYENEHSYREILHIEPLYATINKVVAMLREKQIPSFKFISASALRGSYTEKIIDCSNCGKSFLEFDLIPVTTSKKTKYFCVPCSMRKVKWCRKCGNAFEVKKDAQQTLCTKCRGDKDE